MTSKYFSTPVMASPNEVPAVIPADVLVGLPAGGVRPQKVKKSWGFEYIYANDDRYCCKLLHFLPGFFENNSTSLHFHVQKHETLVVTAGRLTLEYVVNKEHEHKILIPGQAWVVPPGHVHRLTAEEETLVFEVSTLDRIDDSIRIKS